MDIGDIVLVKGFNRPLTIAEIKKQTIKTRRGDVTITKVTFDEQVGCFLAQNIVCVLKNGGEDETL